MTMDNRLEIWLSFNSSMDASPKNTVPSSFFNCFVIVFKIVDFPEPLGPISVSISPAGQKDSHPRSKVFYHSRQSDALCGSPAYMTTSPPVFSTLLRSRRHQKQCRNRADTDFRRRKHGSCNSVTKSVTTAPHKKHPGIGIIGRAVLSPSSPDAALQFRQRRSVPQMPSRRQTEGLIKESS